MAKIRDRSNDRKYFTIIPNIVWTMGLTVYDLWLYATIKRVAGENESCWMSVRQISDMSGVSLGQISKSKEKLVVVGLISVDERESADGPPRDEITVCDVWEKNRFSCSQGDQPAVSCSPHDQARSPGDQLRSPGDQPIIRKKKNPLRRTLEEDVESSTPKETWLTPFFDCWERHLGGKPNGGECARVLKPLVKKYTEKIVVEHLERYLDETEARYVSISRFASTFTAWDGQQRKLVGGFGANSRNRAGLHARAGAGPSPYRTSEKVS